MAIRTDLSVEWDRSPRIITIAKPSTEISIQDLVDSLVAIETDIDNINEPYLLDSSGKEDLGGGVKVGITARLYNAQIAFESRTIAKASGIITSDNLDGAILIDSNAHFITDNVQPGDVITNCTDMSMSSVIKILSETSLKHYILTGGTNNFWSVNDKYKIYSITQCNISGGNLVAVDVNGSGITPIMPTVFTQIVKTSSSSATLQELKDLQYSSFNGGVTVDVTSPYSGTTYPIGTPKNPVNNLEDAILIAKERGFDTIYIIGDMTIDMNGDYRGIIFVGETQTKTTMNIASAAQVEGCEFYNANITGTLDGNARLKDCTIGNLTYVYGVIDTCLLKGTIVLGGENTAYILDSWSGSTESSIPTIDMGESGQSLDLRNYNGDIKIINKTGPENISIDLNSGQVILDSTVTNGNIVIRGIGKLIDNSNGAIVDSEYLLNGPSLVDSISSQLTVNASGIPYLQEAIDKIKLQTDKFKFNSDNDVKATLDGEMVIVREIGTGKKEMITATDFNDMENAIEELRTDSNGIRESLLALYQVVPLVYTYTNSSPPNNISHINIDITNLSLSTESVPIVEAIGTTDTSYSNIIIDPITYTSSNIYFDVIQNTYTEIKLSIRSPVDDVTKYNNISGILTNEVTLS